MLFFIFFFIWSVLRTQLKRYDILKVFNLIYMRYIDSRSILILHQSHVHYGSRGEPLSFILLDLVVLHNLRYKLALPDWLESWRVTAYEWLDFRLYRWSLCKFCGYFGNIIQTTITHHWHRVNVWSAVDILVADYIVILILIIISLYNNINVAFGLIDCSLSLAWTFSSWNRFYLSCWIEGSYSLAL